MIEIIAELEYLRWVYETNEKVFIQESRYADAEYCGRQIENLNKLIKLTQEGN